MDIPLPTELEDFLTPGHPESCPGAGLDPEAELECENCDYYLDCAPHFHRIDERQMRRAVRQIHLAGGDD